jgi:hypothetical protein
MAVKDTVGDKYYYPVRVSESVGFFLFWGSGILSILAFFTKGVWLGALIGMGGASIVNEALAVAFPVFVVALFIQGVAHRLYFLPRAEDARRANLLSDGFGVSLSDDQTEGYYNNKYVSSMERVAANCMESAFFTTSITAKMLKSIRTWTAIYLVLYLTLVVSRRTDIQMIELAAGVIFSEAVLSHWFRSEFLRHRSEDIYEKLRRLFADNPSNRDDHWAARAQEAVLRYETTKAIAAIPVSSKHYLQMNEKLSDEWDRRRKILGF